jgi:hypothetical protein
MEVAFNNHHEPHDSDGDPTFRISADHDSYHSALRALRTEVCARNGVPPRRGLDDGIVALWDDLVVVVALYEADDFKALMVVDSWTTFRI